MIRLRCVRQTGDAGTIEQLMPLQALRARPRRAPAEG